MPVMNPALPRAPEAPEHVLRRATACLTEREAGLFLGHMRGESEAELAERLGYSSAGTVRVALNRIRWYIAGANRGDEEVRALIGDTLHGPEADGELTAETA